MNASSAAGTAIEDPASTALIHAGALDRDIAEAARKADLLRLDIVPVEQAWARDQLGEAGSLRIYHGGPSPFWTSDIDLVLRSNGVRQVLVEGGAEAATRIAYDAARLGYRPLLVDAPAAMAGFVPDWMPRDAMLAALEAVAPGPRRWHEAVKAVRMARPFAERLHPSRTALVLIDVLKDFCAADGVLSKTRAAMPKVEAAVPRIAHLLAQARRAGTTVIHVQAIYGPLFRGQGSPYRYPSPLTAEGAVWCASAAEIDGKAPAFDPSMTEVCREGTGGEGFMPGTEPREGEIVIRKHRYSAWLDTALDYELRRRGIETVVLAGVTTNCCVESTARDLSMQDYDVVVAEDCVAVKDLVAHLHTASIEQIRTYFGIVTPAGKIIQHWQ